jgi:hypothetical protein
MIRFASAQSELPVMTLEVERGRSGVSSKIEFLLQGIFQAGTISGNNLAVEFGKTSAIGDNGTMNTNTLLPMRFATCAGTNTYTISQS